MLGRQQMSCHRHDGTRVDAAAEHRSHRADRAEPAPHRLGEHLEKCLRVLVVRGETKLGPGLERPVPSLSHALRSDGQGVSRRQAVDLLEEGARLVDALEFFDEVVGDSGLVDPIRDLGQDEDCAGLSRKRKEATWAVVVNELTHAHVVAGAEQPLAARVPDGESKVAEEVFDAPLAPFEVGDQGEPRVTWRGFPIPEAQSRDEAPRGCRGGRRR